jgi:ferredoxin
VTCAIITRLVYRKENMTTVTVNEDCIGCETCVGIAPDVFEINDDGVAQVIAGGVDSHVDEATEAAEACPVSAIEVD